MGCAGRHRQVRLLCPGVLFTVQQSPGGSRSFWLRPSPSLISRWSASGTTSTPIHVLGRKYSLHFADSHLFGHYRYLMHPYSLFRRTGTRQETFPSLRSVVARACTRAGDGGRGIHALQTLPSQNQQSSPKWQLPARRIL